MLKNGQQARETRLANDTKTIGRNDTNRNTSVNRKED